MQQTQNPPTNIYIPAEKRPDHSSGLPNPYYLHFNAAPPMYITRLPTHFEFAFNEKPPSLDAVMAKQQEIFMPSIPAEVDQADQIYATNKDIGTETDGDEKKERTGLAKKIFDTIHKEPSKPKPYAPYEEL